MTEKVYNVLFLCAENSARSIMAEAILNKLGHGRFHAFSAGSQPSGHINPLAIDLLKSVGYSVDNLRSKSWDEFQTDDAPEMDFVFTVCSDAAEEVCPVWKGQPVSAHWHFADLASGQGSLAQQKEVVHHVLQEIRQRVQLLLNLPLSKLDKASLHHHVQTLQSA